MKNTFIAIFLLAALTANAQTMYDALTLCGDNYEGTARTLAMGNAFTALGGDLGSITINPAGSAVAKYSQFTVSPGVSIASTVTSGSPGAYFGTSYKVNSSVFNLPNIGMTVNISTDRISGIKNWTMGFVVNKTDNFTSELYARGLNPNTSLSGALATLASGYSRTDLTYTGSSYDPYYDSTIPFDVILAFESGIIDNVVDGNGTQYDYDYVGVAENYKVDSNGDVDWTSFTTGGTLDQIYARTTYGYKYDYVFNFGANISDRLYVGANLGITSLAYGCEYYLKESSGGDAADYADFDTQFSYLKYSYNYAANGVGVYGKFGLIYVSDFGLRLGAAIQTPTALRVTENWQSSAYVSTLSSYGSGSASTPSCEYTYRLSSPWRMNIGAAYTLGSLALVSADYELVNYQKMKFKNIYDFDNSEFEDVNNDIASYVKASHSLRLGLEVRPIQMFAIRAGYGLTSYGILNDNLLKTSSLRHKYSCGLGYSSNNSFFADIAFAATRYATEYIYPYDYYSVDASGNAIIDTTVLTPEIKVVRNLYSIILTLGWRF